jgi:uncharacterized protein
MSHRGIFDKQGLIAHLRGQFQINWMGHHGIPHWMRVRANGLMLSKVNGANTHVLELFAFFHDARRRNEHQDDGHGARGAQLAMQLRGRFFEATNEEMDLLMLACQGHSEGMIEAELTVQTCWDSDRLDLGRVGIDPNPDYLCTEAARQSVHLNKANARAEQWQRTFELRH